MTIRRRLVAITALFVAVPLTLAAVVAVVWAGSVRVDRSNARLQLVLAATQRQLVVRQEALLADVRAAAGGSDVSAGPGTAQALATRLVQSRLVDTATVKDSDGGVVASAGRLEAPGAAAVVLTAAAPLPASALLLTGRVAWSLGGVVGAPDISVSTSSGPFSSSAATLRRQAPLPGGGWLVASASRTSIAATQRRWAAAAIGAVLALLLLVVLVSQAVLGAAARPLERLVSWAEGFTPAGGSTAALDEPEELDRVSRAFRRVARDLRTRSEELRDTRAAFRAALEQLGDTLASTHDLDGILDVMVETALLLVPADAAVYYRLVNPPASLQAAYGRGTGVEGLVLEGTGVAGYAALTGEATVWPGPALPDPKEPPAIAAVAVPLTVLGRLVGVLGVYGTTVGQPFAADDVRALETLLRQAEVAIANIELHSQAQREALTDGVTGLWNRRQFDLRGRDAQLASTRFGEPFAVIIVDVDDFKRINDHYDHFTGDAALVHLASILRSSSREVDVVARWGGEEFAILVQRGGLEEAAVLAERICTSLRSDPLVYGGDVIAFTVSCGVASHPDCGSTATDVVAAADAALLRAKAAGKDRVERAPRLGSEPPSPGSFDLDGEADRASSMPKEHRS